MRFALFVLFGCAACSSGFPIHERAWGGSWDGEAPPCEGRQPRVFKLCFSTARDIAEGEPYHNLYPPAAMWVDAEAHCRRESGRLPYATTWVLQLEYFSYTCSASSTRLLLVPNPDNRGMARVVEALTAVRRVRDGVQPIGPVVAPPFDLTSTSGEVREAIRDAMRYEGQTRALDLRTLRPGDVIRSGGDLALEAIAVTGTARAPNLVTRLTFGGRRALLTGRLDEAGQRALLRSRCGERRGSCEAVRADLLQLQSTCAAVPLLELLEAVRPMVVVVHEPIEADGACPGLSVARARIEAVGATLHVAGENTVQVIVDPADPERQMDFDSDWPQWEHYP